MVRRRVRIVPSVLPATPMSRVCTVLVLSILISTTSPLSDDANAQSPPDSAAVVINEIMYAPQPSSNEFIELYNRSSRTVDLSHLAYGDENRDFDRIASASTVVGPDDYAVLVRDSAAFAANYPSVRDFLPADGWQALNNTGDAVIVRHAPSGRVLDSISFTPSWGGSDGHSLERIDPDGPSSSSTNFGAATPKAQATPGRQNSIYNPDEDPPTPTFAEMIGPTLAEVTFSEPISERSIDPSGFNLPSTRVETATLVAPSRARIHFGSQPDGVTLRVSDITDLVGNTLDGARLPLGRRPQRGDLVVNEIMFAPRTDDFDDRPNQPEYIELVNESDRPLSFAGLRLTDRPNEERVADTIQAGRRSTLRARSYAVIAASPNEGDSLSTSQLAKAFPRAPLTTDSVVVVRPDEARLGLNNDGGLVRVNSSRDKILAEVTYTPDWHSPSLEETKGTALSRISVAGDAQSADNWTSSPADAGGSPGAKNVVSFPTETSTPESNLRISPSPFSIERDGATRIRYKLEHVPSLLRVRIYDARGRKVRTLEDARLAGRTGELVWNGRNDAGDRVRVGIYVILFEALNYGKATEIKLKSTVVVARPLE